MSCFSKGELTKQPAITVKISVNIHVSQTQSVHNCALHAYVIACCARPGLGVDELDGDAGRLVEDILQLPMLLMLLMLSIAFERSFVSARFSFLPA